MNFAPLLDDIALAITAPETKWHQEPLDENATLYAGRGRGWYVQVAVAVDFRLGTAVRGTTIMKLTDELALAAEQRAKAVLAP